MDVKREWLEKDYYEALGVSTDVSDKEIQRCYRKLARELHPDKNPGDQKAEDRFKEVSTAYDVIGNPESRSQYDEVRRMRPSTMGGFSTQGPGVGNLNDLLSGMFGGGGNPFEASGPNMPRAGTHHQAQLRLSFEEAVYGVTTSVSIGGSDGGSRSVKIRIPSGVEDGKRIRVRGKGGTGHNGGPAGDLIVIIRVSSHKLYGRDGNNLTLTLPITYPEAVIGADIHVPTYEGDTVTLRLPPGTESGRIFRVKGRGINTGDTLGDLLVTVEVYVPKNLNPDQIETLQTYAQASEENPRNNLGQL
jgi:molecular chaperone DnaJ